MLRKSAPHLEPLDKLLAGVLRWALGKAARGLAEGGG